MSLISDDSLLVRLFAEKLKLTFDGPKSAAAQREELEANLKKEAEILE
jgi:hypothetical protein